MSAFIGRMIGAATFDDGTYETVEADRHATGQALGVVLLSSLATGLGAGSGHLGAIVTLGAAAVLAWIAWATLVYLIGTTLFPQPQTRADVGELLRTLGYAQAPGVLRAFGVLPLVGPLVLVIVTAWTIATMVVAVRHALDYQSTSRALAVVVTGWIMALAVFAVIGVFWSPIVL
jgi:hypothetical protein